MFGHQDDQSAPADPMQMQQPDVGTPPADSGIASLAPTTPPHQSGGLGEPSDTSNMPLPTAHDDSTATSNGYIATDQHGQPDATGDVSPAAPGADDLLNLKQEALQALSPLVGHLDQTPEEKFHTTMMMIQASDNQDLVKDAYEAAKHISDDKARAQALLDIINEINYFTHQQNS